MDDNEWKPIEGYEGFYEVSSLGEVRSRCRVLKQTLSSDGYPRVTLHKSGHQKVHDTHILVCRAFHGQRPSPAHEVAHGDGVRSHVWAGNLRWATRAENHADMREHGTELRGEKHPLAKIPDALVPIIRAEYVKGDPERGAKALAKKYGVTPNPITRIVHGLRHG